MKKIIFIFFIGIINLFPQTFNITGVVNDSTGSPLVGVNVSITGTSLGTVSDSSGKYSLNHLKPGNYSIEFSYIGFKTTIITNQLLKDKSIVLTLTLQQQPIESRQIVVSASKYSQKISELPVSAEIIHSDQLEKKDITDMKDAMRYVPGVNMIDDQISIRGSSGYSRGAGTRVLLEIDGIPYYTGDTGEIIWEIIPVSEVQRIEVIKGAASSLYGSSAIGGVVNIITNDIPKNPVTFIKTSIGAYDKPSYSTWDWSSELRTNTGLTVAHSDNIGSFGYALSLTRLSDMSYEQSDYYTRYIGFFKGNYAFSPASSLTLLANSLNQVSGNFIYWKDSRNVLVPPDADQGESVTAGRYMFGAIYNDVINDKLFFNLKGSYYRSDWWDQTVSHDSSISNLFRLEVQSNASLSDNLIIVSGAEASHDQVNSNIFSTKSAYGFGLYTQADYKFWFPLSTTFGARYDFSRIGGEIGVSAFSPKAGLNYRLADNMALRASFGTGFRAPTLSEAFTSTTASGITIKPNPNLKPETNWTAEIGANYQASNFIDFDASLFQNEFYDFIEPNVDPADGLVFFENVTRARIQGCEFNSDFSFLENKLKLSLNYTYLWARDLQLNQPLKYRPRNMVNASIDYFVYNFNFGADYRYSSKVEEIDFQLIDLGVIKDGALRSDINVLDLRTGYDLHSTGLPVKVFFNINNALNYNYVELIGNLAPIRNYTLSAEFLF